MGGELLQLDHSQRIHDDKAGCEWAAGQAALPTGRRRPTGSRCSEFWAVLFRTINSTGDWETAWGSLLLGSAISSVTKSMQSQLEIGGGAEGKMEALEEGDATAGGRTATPEQRAPTSLSSRK